jgi:hypothetical protein
MTQSQSLAIWELIKICQITEGLAGHASSFSECETRSELHYPILGKWGHKKSKKLPHKNRLSSEYYLVVASTLLHS